MTHEGSVAAKPTTDAGDISAHIRSLEEQHPDRLALVDALVLDARGRASQDYQLADQMYARAIDLAQQSPRYDAGLAVALAGRAFTAFRLGNHAEGLSLAQHARGLAERIGDEERAVAAVITFGQIHRNVGNFDDAIEALFEGVERARAHGYRDLEARASNSLGALFSALGNLDDSRRYFERALVLEESLRSAPHAIQAICSNLSNCLRQLGLADEAVSLARRAVSESQVSGNQQDRSYHLSCLAAALVVQGELNAALETFAEAEVASQDSPGQPLSDIKQRFADALLRAGYPQRAQQVAEEAYEHCRDLPQRPLQAIVLKTLSQCHAMNGDFERAYEEEIKAQEIRAALGAEGSIERHRVYQVMREADESRERSESLEQLVDERTRALREEMQQRQQAQEALQREAFTTALTGLPNRLALIESIDQRLEYCREDPGRQFGLLFMNVSRFRRINDSLGYARADRVVSELASRLLAILEPEQRLFHLGADEFAVLMDQINDDTLLARQAAALRREASRPIQVDERDIHLTIDVGGVLGNTSYQQADHVLLDADTAMTRAKEQSKGFQFFNRHMRERAAGQFRLETELRRAIRQQEFEVYYQPIVNQRMRSLKGFEALVRWNHPVRGILGADNFVAAAAQMDLLQEIDRMVLRRACSDLRHWRERYRLAHTITISVNLSPQHMSHPSWDDELDELLSEFDDVSGQVSLEITEAALMDIGRHQVARLERLRKRGVGWVIDDFGTGYSSLSYLQRLPVDCLKIDRSFVTGLPTGERELRIIGAIVELARALQLETVAEGVESRPQMDALKQLGCNLIQGYLFAAALPRDEATVFLVDPLPEPGVHSP